MMKKILILFLCFFTICGYSQNIKEAEKFLYKKNYTEAKKSINKVLSDSSSSLKYTPWFIKGEVYMGEFQASLKKASYSDSAILLVDSAYAAYKCSKTLLDSNVKEFPFDLLVGMQNCGIHYNNKGIIEYQKANLDTALYFICKAIEIDNDRNKVDTTKYYNCFAIALNAKNNQKANFYGNYLLDSLKYTNENIYGGLIQLNIDNNNQAEANKILDKAICEYPNNPNFKNLQINWYLADTNKIQAITNLEALYINDSSNVYLTNTIANLYFSQGEHEKGLKYFKRLTKLDSTNFNVYYNIASVYFNEAVELNNSIGESDLSESEINKKVNQLFKEALPFFETAHKLKGNDLQCIESLKLIYNKLPGYRKQYEHMENLLIN